MRKVNNSRCSGSFLCESGAQANSPPARLQRIDAKALDSVSVHLQKQTFKNEAETKTGVQS